MPYRPDFWPNNKNGNMMDIMTISLELHMNANGSSDCLSIEEKELYIKSLRHALDNWRLVSVSTAHFHYDQAVRNLIIETLKEHGYVINLMGILVKE